MKIISKTGDLLCCPLRRLLDVLLSTPVSRLSGLPRISSRFENNLQRWLLKQAGFTVIEIVLAVTTLAVALPPLLHLFSETAVTGAEAAILPTANLLGNELMEEIKSRKFDELSAKAASGNWSTTLGTDAGEAGNKTLFEDVDDFNGWAQGFGASYPNYTASVSVDYVASNNLNTTLVIPSPTPNNWTPSYKRIVVSVSNPGIAAPIQLVTIVTEVQSL